MEKTCICIVIIHVHVLLSRARGSLLLGHDGNLDEWNVRRVLTKYASWFIVAALTSFMTHIRSLPLSRTWHLTQCASLSLFTQVFCVCVDASYARREYMWCYSWWRRRVINHGMDTDTCMARADAASSDGNTCGSDGHGSDPTWRKTIRDAARLGEKDVRGDPSWDRSNG